MAGLRRSQRIKAKNFHDTVYELLTNYSVDDRNELEFILIPPDVDTDNEEISDELDALDDCGIEIFDLNDDIENVTQSELQTSNHGYFDYDEPQWVKKDAVYSSSFAKNQISTIIDSNFDRMKTDIQGLTPRKIFEKMFSIDLVQHICDQSILYATQKQKTFHVEPTEMRTFLAILLLTGYHTLPQERMYWSMDDDLGVPMVYNSMSRDRYLTIKRFLHVADNSKLDSNDRMFKIRPMINILTKNFCQWAFIHINLSIDETMVEYFGRHPTKQFMLKKPIRYGYKCWLLCSSSGYCYVFDVYCGKSRDKPRPNAMPVGAKVVIDLLEHVAKPEEHIVFFDNHFTTYALMVYLKKKKFRATGTVRENRIQKVPITTCKDLNKMPRGSHDYRFDTKNEILLVKWHDNSACSILSNYDSVKPLLSVKRWCSAQQGKKEFDQPAVFNSYNGGMGGVDTHNQCLSLYRVAIKGKKWWWVLFTSMLDMCVVNSWKVHQMIESDDKKLNQLDFRRNIVRSYLQEASVLTGPKRRRPISPRNELTFNGQHFPRKLEKQLRCYLCHQKSTWTCSSCSKTFCLTKGCFEKYHSRS